MFEDIRSIIPSLCQGVDNVLHQHGANQHFLTVDGQVCHGTSLLLQGDENETSTANRLSSKSAQKHSAERSNCNIFALNLPATRLHPTHFNLSFVCSRELTLSLGMGYLTPRIKVLTGLGLEYLPYEERLQDLGICSNLIDHLNYSICSHFP